MRGAGTRFARCHRSRDTDSPRECSRSKRVKSVGPPRKPLTSLHGRFEPDALGFAHAHDRNGGGVGGLPSGARPTLNSAGCARRAAIHGDARGPAALPGCDELTGLSAGDPRRLDRQSHAQAVTVELTATPRCRRGRGEPSGKVDERHRLPVAHDKVVVGGDFAREALRRSGSAACGSHHPGG